MGGPIFCSRGWSGVIKDGELLKWRPSVEMVSATVKFTLETGRLAEESRGNEPEPEESEVDRSSEEEDSGIEEEALGV